MPITKRNIVLIYLLGIVTLGIYFIYWMWKTKEELNELGADIPSAILIIIPIANVYWLYKYAKGFAKVTRKESELLWFIVFLLVPIAMPAISQSELNKIAKR